jgi:hypothetical protein
MSPSGGLDTLEEGNIYFPRCNLYHQTPAVILSGEGRRYAIFSIHLVLLIQKERK